METTFKEMIDRIDVNMIPKQLLLDRIDAAHFHLDEMVRFEEMDPRVDNDCHRKFRYSFDGFINALMAVNNFYKRVDEGTFDYWVDEEWKADLHNHLRTELRNAVHHPDDWIDNPEAFVLRHTVGMDGRNCFGIGDLPSSFVDYWHKHEHDPSSDVPPNVVPVIDICQVYLRMVERWVKTVERIDSGWFRVPRIGTGDHDDSYRPKYSGKEEISGYAGNSFENEAPRYVVRFNGTPEAIESIASEEDAIQLGDDEVVKLFNRMQSVSNFSDIESVNNSFAVASRRYGV